MSETRQQRARRDQRIADEAPANPRLRCRAEGCPNRWSVAEGQSGDGVQGLCSAHAWSDTAHWPAITQQQLDAEADRAFAAQRPRTPPRYLSRAERDAAMQHLRESLGRLAQGPRGSRDWAYRLKVREDEGERLTMAQREAWRTALRAHETLDDVQAGAPVPREAVDRALQHTGDVPTLSDEEALWAMRAADAASENLTAAAEAWA